MWSVALNPFVVILLSMLLERLCVRWLAAQGVKHGKLRDRDDPRAFLLGRVLFLSLTLVALAGWIAATSNWELELPARGAGIQPAELADRLHQQQESILNLVTAFTATLVYVSTRMLGLGARLVALASPMPAVSTPAGG